MARYKELRYIDADALIEVLQEWRATSSLNDGAGNPVDSILYDAIRHIEDASTADVAPRAEWISVEERLPQECTQVIVCDEGWTVGEAFYYKEGRFEWIDSEELAFVTHWMPMPDPPKGE